MQLDSSFKVPLPLDEAWRVLLDPRRVAGCVPGATTATAVTGDDVTGQLRLRLGPAWITYQGKVTVTGTSADRHTVSLTAAGREVGGNGIASAVVSATLSDAGGGTTEVAVSSDVSLGGSSAQFGQGVLADVVERLVSEFAGNLSRELDRPPATTTPAPAPVTAPTPSVAPATPVAPSATGLASRLPAALRSQAAARLAPALAAAAAVAGIAVVRRALRSRA